MKRFINPVPQFFLDNGELNGSGHLYFYENGSTTTLKNTYNADGGAANTNPVRLDGEGRCPSIFGDGLYTIKMTDTDDVQQWVRHNVEFSGTEGQFSDWSAVISYDLNDIVRYTDGNYYKSDVVSNIGNNPSTASTKWSQVTFIEVFNPDKAGGYADEAIVSYNGYLYRSNDDDNEDTPPSAKWDNLTFNNSIVGDFDVSGTVTAQEVIADNIVKSAIKTGSTARSSTTTVSADPDLVVSDLINGSYYKIFGQIRWTDNGGGAANGIRLTFDSGSDKFVPIMLYIQGRTAFSPTISNNTGDATFEALLTNNEEIIEFSGIVRIDGAATSIGLYWAQKTSSATNTTINFGSLSVIKLT
jgi:hypothetical protein